MEETENNIEQIQYITVLPHNQVSFKFLINDQEETYSKPLSKGEIYLQGFIELKDKRYLNELIYSFIPFIIDIKEKKIIELAQDKDKALREIRDNIKKNTFTNNTKDEEKDGLDIQKRLSYNTDIYNNIMEKQKKGWKL